MVYVQTVNRQTVLFVLVALSLCLPLASRAQSSDGTDSAKSSPAATDTSGSLNSGKGTTPGTDSSKAPVVDPQEEEGDDKETGEGTDSSKAPVANPANSQALLDGLTALKKRLDEAKAKGIGVASYASQCQRLEERIRSGESSDDLKASLDALNRGLKEQVEHVSPAQRPQPAGGHGETKGPSKSSSKYKAIVLCIVQGARQKKLVNTIDCWINQLVKQKDAVGLVIVDVGEGTSAGIIRARSDAHENAILSRVCKRLDSGNYFVGLTPQFAVCDRDWNLKSIPSMERIPYDVADLVKQAGAPQKK